MNPGDGDKRRQIIKAAVKVFSQKGFHEAKVDEIAQLADVGKGTVYEYFSSKAELFQEMFKAGLQFYADNLSGELRPGLSGREKLERIAKIHIRFVMRYKDLAKITMTEHAHFNEDFRKWIWENRAKKIEALEQIISEGIDSGEFRRIDARAAAMVFTGVLGSLFSPIVFSKGNSTNKDLLEPVLSIFFNGLLQKE